MASYRNIHGHAIKSYAGDPSNPLEGQVWYNSVTKKLRCRNNSSTLTITTL
jgi:hypothetical protein